MTDKNRFELKPNKWILEKINPDGTKIFLAKKTINNWIITKHTKEFNQERFRQQEAWRQNNKTKNKKISF